MFALRACLPVWLCSGWIALSSLCEALLAAFVDARDTMLLQYHGSNPDEMPAGFGWCNPPSAWRTVSTHGSRFRGELVLPRSMPAAESLPVAPPVPDLWLLLVVIADLRITLLPL